MVNGVDELVDRKVISKDGADLLMEILKHKPNILVIGKSGSGKTFTIKRILKYYGHCNVGFVRGFKQEYSNIMDLCRFFDFDTIEDAINTPLKIDIILNDSHSIDFNKLKNAKQQLIFETSAMNLERIIHYLGKNVFKVLIKTDYRECPDGGKRHVINTIKVMNPDVGLYMPVYRCSDNYLNRDLIKKVFEFKPKVTL